MYLLVDEKPVGAIALADIIRAESRVAVEKLRAAGMQVMMLTGDSKAVAAWVADELGLDDYFAEVLPCVQAPTAPRAARRALDSWQSSK